MEPQQPVGETFQYEPLVGEHDIRLLRLEENYCEPGTVEGRIVGKLTHMPLSHLASDNSSCPYYAISYTWGDSTLTDQLWLSKTEYLPITAPAAYILRRVTRDEYVWIDSVCINQANSKEKSTQLRYMWGIYKYAKEVLAWLGDAEDGGDLAMELLFDINYAELTKELTGRTPVTLPIGHTEFLPELNTALWKKSRPPMPPDFHFDPERWLALAKFLDRPWWRRAWVIQELVAAREVTIMLGAARQKPDDPTMQWKLFHAHTAGYILKWEHLVTVVEHLQRWDFLYVLEMTENGTPCDLPIYPEAVASIRRVAALKPAQQDERPNYQDNLLLTMAVDATEPRDKVFAIGSMSYGSLTEELWPKYELPVEDVYINATRHLLMRDQYLMTLHMAGIGWHRKMDGLPTWVPDYSTTRRTGTRHGTDFVLGQIARSAMFASASLTLSDLKAEVKNLGSWRRLIRIRGVVIDDIQVVCKGLPPKRSIRRSMNSENWIDRKVIRSWMNMVGSQICNSTFSKPYLSGSATKTYPPRVSMLEYQALASALIVGSSYEGGPMGFTNLHTPLGMMYKKFLACVENGTRPCKISGSAAMINGLDTYINALDRLPSWTVFRTASGYIGRGPPLVQKGDKVCVFESGRTPFIIRKAAMPRLAPSTFYHLVGECYVEGLMSTEATRISRWKWGLITLW